MGWDGRGGYRGEGLEWGGAERSVLVAIQNQMEKSGKSCPRPSKLDPEKTARRKGEVPGSRFLTPRRFPACGPLRRNTLGPTGPRQWGRVSYPKQSSGHRRGAHARRWVGLPETSPGPGVGTPGEAGRSRCGWASPIPGGPPCGPHVARFVRPGAHFERVRNKSGVRLLPLSLFAGGAVMGKCAEKNGTAKPFRHPKGGNGE